jgi:hypothetical protein
VVEGGLLPPPEFAIPKTIDVRTTAPPTLAQNRQLRARVGQEVSTAGLPSCGTD